MMYRLLQFTLDLFDAVPAPVKPAAQPRAQKPLELPKKGAPSPAEVLPPALKKTALSPPSPSSAPVELPAPTLPPALAHASFRHPRATRESLLDGILVAYAFRRGKRKTIGFSVGPEGLVVSAPKWVPLHDIDQSVLDKSGWILRKLQETRARHDRLESTRIDWKEGATLPFLGDPLVVVIDPRHAFSGVYAELKIDANALPGVPHQTLQVGLPHSASPEQIRDAVQAWLMRQATRIFTERLDHFNPQLGVKWRKLSLSSAGTRWGSASADGSIRLNWRLIHCKMSVIDYVVVHELSHLRVMDHSPRFWDTVRAVLPDYAELRGKLKDEAVPRW